jgi:hypothetical protein
LDPRQELPLRHRVALADQELLQAPLHLRADDHVVGGDDAGQHELARAVRHGVVEPAAQYDDGGERDREAAHHGRGA